ncbi:U2 small nuclear ribonucleoprotein auxiliary factor 35 kDa subunit-related protein 2 isoform X1 [Drosophila bipectinata]|uniref:U2 small nuclear ribonucleoprotein auxiliary factor 35 kDa subunit-related protein 2 isoform X1 n=1 Tax=Drosophila bipectinata TaxID=42026 RepID=UPI001C8A24AB|nr:U2 small nuclear ribonucleoprotein auxiliary factor 35 kDa subunit-related protein 2 [Drosophila bipectinata]
MPGKRPRRKLTKKKQRQYRRQKKAKERDRLEEEAENQRLSDPEYQKWQKQQYELEEFQRLALERKHLEEEETWLRREAIAQRQFRLDDARRRKEQSEAERLMGEQARELAEREEARRKVREENERQIAKANAEFEAMMQNMHEYLNNPQLEKPPKHLLRIMETHPGERACELYSRTNCCRYGHSCTFNHPRPMLSRILLIRHFFSHSLLQERKVHKEYASADEELELTEQDLRSDYDEFFEDAVKELEKFGSIINFRALRNTLEHLRGHVFVEYAHERSALRAFINLQGRYYASRRLNVEFSHLKTWRGAVCGMSLTRKCPKGNTCLYLHLFRNPKNLFNRDLEKTTTPRSDRNFSQTPTVRTPSASWDSQDEPGRNWRWSESPEPDLKSSKDLSNQKSRTRSHSNRSHSEHHSKSFKSNRDCSSSGSRSSHNHRSRRSSNSDSKHHK